MVFRAIIFSLLIAVLPEGFKSMSGQNGDQTPNLSSLSDVDLKTVTIQLERTACYGTCPTYSITIHGDGRVEYNGKNRVKEVGPREARIEQDQTRALIAVFTRTKFWDLAEDYSETKCKGRVCNRYAHRNHRTDCERCVSSREALLWVRECPKVTF